MESLPREPGQHSETFHLTGRLRAPPAAQERHEVSAVDQRPPRGLRLRLARRRQPALGSR
jgi:hypothetical protein